MSSNAKVGICRDMNGEEGCQRDPQSFFLHERGLSYLVSAAKTYLSRTPTFCCPPNLRPTLLTKGNTFEEKAGVNACNCRKQRRRRCLEEELVISRGILIVPGDLGLHDLAVDPHSLAFAFRPFHRFVVTFTHERGVRLALIVLRRQPKRNNG